MVSLCVIVSVANFRFFLRMVNCYYWSMLVGSDPRGVGSSAVEWYSGDIVELGGLLGFTGSCWCVSSKC